MDTRAAPVSPQLNAWRTPWIGNTPLHRESGVASIIAPVGDGVSVEVGTVGSEGLVGLPLLFVVDREPAQAFVQKPMAPFE